MSDAWAWVVESPVTNDRGARCATARVYVGTEERAKEIADAHPERSYRALGELEVPEAARENLRRAREEASS